MGRRGGAGREREERAEQQEQRHQKYLVAPDATVILLTLSPHHY